MENNAQTFFNHLTDAFVFNSEGNTDLAATLLMAASDQADEFFDEETRREMTRLATLQFSA